MLLKKGNIESKKALDILWENICRSIKMVVNYSNMYIPITFGVKIFQGILPAFFLFVLKQTINILQTNNDSFEKMNGYIILLILGYIINGVITILYDKYNYEFSMEFTNKINLNMMNKAISLSLRDFEDPKIYDIINRAQNQNGDNIIQYIHLIFEIIQQCVLIISMGYMLIYFKWYIATIIILMPFGRSIVTYFYNKELYEIRKNRTSSERKKWYINFLIMTGHAYKEIKILGIGPFLINRYNDIQEKIIIQEKMKNNEISNKNIIMNTIEWLITGSIYLYIFRMGFLGKILIGDVTVFIECINNIKNAASIAFKGVSRLIEQSMYIGFLFEYLDLSEKSERGKVKIDKIRSIEFRNVSFRYNKDEFALKNISFRIKIGKAIAFVGENGSGKTTLIKLILGLYDRYDGIILVNDIDLRKIDMESYHEKIGIVLQDYIKYETSIRENVAYGNMNMIEKDSIIENLLKKVHFEYNTQESEGLDTIVGNWFGKKQCSLGEWQRLAIARALIREADVYMWDEPDASLDILCQRDIIELFKEVKRNKIAIYITHKINYVNELVDTIITMNKGEFVEIGEHNELIEKKGYYYQLYTESSQNV